MQGTYKGTLSLPGYSKTPYQLVLNTGDLGKNNFILSGNHSAYDQSEPIEGAIFPDGSVYFRDQETVFHGKVEGLSIVGICFNDGEEGSGSFDVCKIDVESVDMVKFIIHADEKTETIEVDKNDIGSLSVEDFKLLIRNAFNDDRLTDDFVLRIDVTRLAYPDYKLFSRENIDTRNNDTDSFNINLCFNKSVTQSDSIVWAVKTDNVEVLQNYQVDPLRVYKSFGSGGFRGGDGITRGNICGTLLHIAASNGAVKVAEYLLTQGFNVNAHSGFNMSGVGCMKIASSFATPLYLSKLTSGTDMDELLEQHGGISEGVGQYRTEKITNVLKDIDTLDDIEEAFDRIKSDLHVDEIPLKIHNYWRV
eukprot:TRINITY_DN10689_c0_g1_i1.p1 TRINITY_DN10689_c0_g1~~TRINITY_DN10689_c0_g1_i1.p1  ORF type:complete len:363 (-),score=73.38 TRINITY_DN10689_c0_g1_i1:65-1153(-)